MEYTNRKARLILRRMKLLLAFAKKENESLRKEIARLPEGSLQIKNCHGSFVCYEDNGTSRKGLSRQDAKTKSLARKAIAKYDLANMDELETVLENAIQTVELICRGDRFRPGKTTVMRIPEINKGRFYYLTQDERTWLNSIKKAKELYPERLKYRTKRGLMVRSKSEMIIADMLDELGILYAYEPRLIIGGRTIVPDFVIYRADGEMIIWEHFGMLDDPVYRQRALEKIELYGTIGYRQHTNLICTDESDIANPRSIARIIEERIMI